MRRIVVYAQKRLTVGNITENNCRYLPTPMYWVAVEPAGWAAGTGSPGIAAEVKTLRRQTHPQHDKHLDDKYPPHDNQNLSQNGYICGGLLYTICVCKQTTLNFSLF